MAKKDPNLGDGMVKKAADKMRGRKRTIDAALEEAESGPKVDSAARGHGSENRKKKK
jgi:hypothetical protein